MCFEEPPVRDIFLMYFLHETLFCTARGGGIQLDRLILPNRSFVELNEHYISLFFMEDPTVSEPASLARLVHSVQWYSALLPFCFVRRNSQNCALSKFTFKNIVYIVEDIFVNFSVKKYF